MSTQDFMKGEFTLMLRAFDKIIDGYPSIEKVKDELLELKQAAYTSSELNFNQREAIAARCENYIKGIYGNQVKKIDNRSDYSKSLK